MTACPKPKKAARKPLQGREVLADTGKGSEYERRTWEMAKRQGYACAICGKAFSSFLPASFDHERTRGMGGGYRDDRIEVEGRWRNAAICLNCQIVKGSRRYCWNEAKLYVPYDRKAQPK